MAQSCFYCLYFQNLTLNSPRGFSRILFIKISSRHLTYSYSESTRGKLVVMGCAENGLCDNREVDMPDNNPNYSLARNS